MAKKSTTMELKVDLECEKCVKKMKKALCKFPQIRDQVFNEKQSIVIIRVVCCEPEKLRDKICGKGGGSIKSIKIVEEKPPDEPKQEGKKKSDELKKEPEKTKEPEKKKKKPEKTEKEPEKEKKQESQPKSESPSREKSKTKPKKGVTWASTLEKILGPKSPASNSAATAAALAPVPEYPSLVAVPFETSYVTPYYEDGSGGPWFHGYYGGQPLHPSPMYYGGYYGKAVYDSYGGSTYYVNRCDKYDAGEGAASQCTAM